MLLVWRAKISKDAGKQVLPAKWEKTAGRSTGNIRCNDFKLRVIKWGLVYEALSEDNYHLMGL